MMVHVHTALGILKTINAITTIYSDPRKSSLSISINATKQQTASILKSAGT